MRRHENTCHERGKESGQEIVYQMCMDTYGLSGLLSAAVLENQNTFLIAIKSWSSVTTAPTNSFVPSLPSFLYI